MLLMTIHAFRRYAAMRHASGLLAITAALLMAAEFALLAAPAATAQPTAGVVLLEGRYSSEPQLLPVQGARIDVSPFIEP
jgi:hypothetical protein